MTNNTEYAKGNFKNVYGEYVICSSKSGSNRWFAVRAGVADIHPINAAWIALTTERIEAQRAQGVYSDGCVRFFQTKRALIDALNGV